MVTVDAIIKRRFFDRARGGGHFVLNMALETINRVCTVMGFLFGHVEVGMGLEFLAVVYIVLGLFPQILIRRPMTKEAAIGLIVQNQYRLIRRLEYQFLHGLLGVPNGRGICFRVFRRITP